MSDDIVIDILLRLSRALGADSCPDSLLITVEKEVRNHWGGDRPYIGKTRLDCVERSHRDRRIMLDWQNGERQTFLARRYNLSVRRIREIIRKQRAG